MIAEDFGPVYTRARARARDRKHSGLRLREHVRARPVCTRGQKIRARVPRKRGIGAASAVRYRHDHRHRGQTSETQELFDADKRPSEKCGLVRAPTGAHSLRVMGISLNCSIEKMTAPQERQGHAEQPVRGHHPFGGIKHRSEYGGRPATNPALWGPFGGL